MKDTRNFEEIKREPRHANRRKIAREVATFYDDLAREAGFTPAERRTACAISTRLYERSGEPCETPRGISLGSIGEALTSRSDSEEARAKTAQRHVGELFNQAIPRTSYQILTRYKAAEDSGKPHQYADHLLPVAALFSELLAEERGKILSTKGIEKYVRRAQIEEARQRLITEALTYLPRCEAEIISLEGESYARLSEPEAKAFCERNPGYSARPYKYSPPAEPPKRRLGAADFDRLKERAKRIVVDQILDEIAERNSPEAARKFWREELLPAIQRAGASWSKVIGGHEQKDRLEELIHAPDLSRGVATNPNDSSVNWEIESEWKTPDNLSGILHANSIDPSDLENRFSEIDFLGEAEPAPEPPESINFDSALEAAEFYARDGWHVLPICQFDSTTGRCTEPKHKPDKDDNPCTGKRPLVKGEDDHKPGDGHTAASRDMILIRDWYRQFPDAGVGLRLDGYVLIDCDVKDGAGGLESYQILADTFALPETLTAITHSGGRHYVFKLPDNLPQGWLKSWTRVGDKIALGGIDLKVGKCGLLCAEPTRGSKGVYRWVDPTVPPAVLPREVCDFLRAARYKDEKTRAEKTKAARVYSSSDQSQEFQSDQALFFKDVPRGDRHKRLLKIGTAIRCQTRASAAEIVGALRYHAARFSDPLDDEPWIQRTAKSIERSF